MSIGREITYQYLSTTLINVYRKVLGSFSERLYWFGSLPLCSSIVFLCIRSIVLPLYLYT
ncbi:hypothetical protein 3043_01 [Acinetobacter phage vB_Api_3043-K38]|uniref:Uncharacterized protein n=1 Tax=Acinetobacter phage vB_Api_3043-K38 TaxID=2862717 RepID=A0AC61N9S1_9CAUD|nr:hypothetical protein 3043_01 [Acinetobacter phage vB_Api_3043-K38]